MRTAHSTSTEHHSHSTDDTLAYIQTRTHTQQSHHNTLKIFPSGNTLKILGIVETISAHTQTYTHTHSDVSTDMGFKKGFDHFEGTTNTMCSM